MNNEINIFRQHFPSIDLEDPANLEAFEKFYWVKDYENKEYMAEFTCKRDEFSLNMVDYLFFLFPKDFESFK